MVFQQSSEHSDHRLLRKASRAFGIYLHVHMPLSLTHFNAFGVRFAGHLVRAGGTLAYEIVEFEVKRSLEWLEVSMCLFITPFCLYVIKCAFLK